MTDKSDCPPQVADNLPRDATGRVVPFDVAKVYNFKPGYAPRVVLGLKYSRNLGQWLFELDNGAYGRCTNYYLDPPDSWERLLEDLDRAADTTGATRCACSYLTGDAGTECDDCKSYKKGRWCVQIMVEDIARRIRELREADNAD